MDRTVDQIDLLDGHVFSIVPPFLFFRGVFDAQSFLECFLRRLQIVRGFLDGVEIHAESVNKALHGGPDLFVGLAQGVHL